MTFRVLTGEISVYYSLNDDNDFSGDIKEKKVVISADKGFQRVVMHAHDREDHLSKDFRWRVEAKTKASEYSMDIQVDENNQFWGLGVGTVVNTELLDGKKQNFFVDNRASKDIENIKIKINGPSEALGITPKTKNLNDIDTLRLFNVKRLPNTDKIPAYPINTFKFFNNDLTEVTLVLEIDASQKGFFVLEAETAKNAKIRVNAMVNNIVEMALNSRDRLVIPPQQSAIY